jgi:two-component system, NarL family, response regulator DesR
MGATILIAEDDFLIREGTLRSLLEPHFTIVASVDDGREAIEAASEYKPDVVLLDVSLPRVRGFEAARQILEAAPSCKVLFVSNYADPEYSETARELGAVGYVIKSRAAIELVPAIETVLTGHFFQSSF